MTWKTVSCTARGRGHARLSLPCQDMVADAFADGRTCIALADGAGSATHSHFGAARVTAAATAYLCKNFPQLIGEADGRLVKIDLVKHLQAVLREEQAERDCALRDLASTLLCAAVDGKHFLLAHLGDGVLGYLQGHEAKVASRPVNGEFCNTTVFLTSANAVQSLNLFKGELGSINGFVLMSDGTEQSLYRKADKRLAPLVERLFTLCRVLPEEHAARILAQTLGRISDLATQDDCSIAFLVKPMEGITEFRTLPFSDRCITLGIAPKDRQSSKRLALCEALLAYLNAPRTLKQVARFLHLRPGYAKRRVDALCEIGLLRREGGSYRVTESLRDSA